MIARLPQHLSWHVDGILVSGCAVWKAEHTIIRRTSTILDSIGLQVQIVFKPWNTFLATAMDMATFVEAVGIVGGVWRSLFVARCLLYAVCCLLFDVLSFVVPRFMFVVRCALFVVCCLLSVVCCMFLLCCFVVVVGGCFFGVCSCLLFGLFAVCCSLLLFCWLSVCCPVSWFVVGFCCRLCCVLAVVWLIRACLWFIA